MKKKYLYAAASRMRRRQAVRTEGRVTVDGGSFDNAGNATIFNRGKTGIKRKRCCVH